MKFHELKTTVQKARKRVGRGISAGGGKTAGRGTKGQNARAGGGVRPGFEGGQNPFMQRVPKQPGFKSKRPEVYEIYTGELNQLKATGKITNHTLVEAGLVPDAYHRVKVIKKGDALKKALKLELQGISKSAKAELEKAGGSFTQAALPQRDKKK